MVMPVLTDESSAAINNGDVALKEKAVEAKTEQAVKTDVVVVPNKPVFDFFKRVFDILASFLVLTVGFPVYLIIVLAIIIDDFGNPFFVQERIGKDLKPFKMIKFRTMRHNTDGLKDELLDQNQCEDGVHFKIDSDPRITRVGKLLRKTSIDEFPQMVNVFLGNMSFVGPRPFIRKEQEMLPSERLLIKPGLSCYWQIADTTKMPADEQMELDYRYIRERSVKTDIKIIWLTVLVIFRGKNC
ncbi:MAG: sugar transferase [Oscillospiraceae bacterium]|nr:sugar transferase [Oscillospiraceae bacterium]